MELREFDTDRVLACMGKCSQCGAIGGCDCDEHEVAELERFIVEEREGLDCEIIGDMLELADRELALLAEIEQGGAA